MCRCMLLCRYFLGFGHVSLLVIYSIKVLCCIDIKDYQCVSVYILVPSYDSSLIIAVSIDDLLSLPLYCWLLRLDRS
jgi:hypothetical protein